MAESPIGITGRTGVQIDGVPAYTSGSAWWNGGAHHLGNNPGFPALTLTDAVDATTGNLAIDEHSPFVTCAENPAVYPPTDASCASFAGSGLSLDREIRTLDNGLQVRIVDHWKSVDGKAHALDAIYSDVMESSNATISGREARLNFTWTPDGFTTYPDGAQIPLPARRSGDDAGQDRRLDARLRRLPEPVRRNDLRRAPGRGQDREPE